MCLSLTVLLIVCAVSTPTSGQYIVNYPGNPPSYSTPYQCTTILNPLLYTDCPPSFCYFEGTAGSTCCMAYYKTASSTNRLITLYSQCKCRAGNSCSLSGSPAITTTSSPQTTPTKAATTADTITTTGVPSTTGQATTVTETPITTTVPTTTITTAQP